MYFAIRHLPWIASSTIGLILLAAGVVLMTQGMSTRNQIREELQAERVTTSKDAAIPGVLVQDAATARAQADAIKNHTLGKWGPYSELPKDDPRRAQFIDGVALRTALNMAMMGFRITELVIGAGAIVTFAGVATLLLATPSVYMVAGAVAAHREQAHGHQQHPAFHLGAEAA